MSFMVNALGKRFGFGAARDPWTLAIAAIALLAASLAAAWLPTWRATRIDPVEVLRET